MRADGELYLNIDLPHDVTVVSCRLVEGMSKQTHARVEIASTVHIDLTGVLERDATLFIAPEGFPPRTWTLRVGHIDFIEIKEGSFRYVANLYPEMWLLRFTTNTRKFRNMSSEQIISQILDAHGVDHRFELMRKTETRKYCAQYRETNLDFILRLLEFEGIYYTFEDDGTVVFADRSIDGARTDGKSAFDLIEASGAMSWDDIGIFEFHAGRRLASGTATVNDHNWKTPSVKLLTSSVANDDAELEIYDYPVGFRRPDQGSRLAQLRLEAQRVPSRYVGGKSNVTAFRPGRLFAFGPMANPIFADDYLLTDVEHVYVNRKFSEADMGNVAEDAYRNHFAAIPKSVPFRPPLVTPHPHIAGCHTAMVVGPQGEEIHTDQYGRYRAKFHWDREATGTDEDSRWLRNTQETASGMVLARVGWEQSIAYVNGDPDRPFGFARNINGQMVPEYTQPVNKTRMAMKSPTYPGKAGFNELRLEDLAGQQHMDWHAEKDMLGLVENDRSEHIEGNSSKKVGSGYAWSVGNNQDVSIKGNYEVGVSMNYSLSVEKDRTKEVTGDETCEINTTYSYFVTGNSKEEVTADRIVDAADKGGTITREVETKWTRTVKGDVTVQGKGNMEFVVQGTYDETITGDKSITCNKGHHLLRVGGIYTLDVGTMCTRRSGTSMGFAANITKVDVGANALFGGNEKINLNSDRLILMGDAMLGFQSKGLMMKLQPGKITFSGAMKLEAGNNINVKGNKNNITNQTAAEMLKEKWTVFQESLNANLDG